MKEVYLPIEVQITNLESDDIIMISDLDIKDTGLLKTVDWNEFL